LNEAFSAESKVGTKAGLLFFDSNFISHLFTNEKSKALTRSDNFIFHPFAD